MLVATRLRLLVFLTACLTGTDLAESSCILLTTTSELSKISLGTSVVITKDLLSAIVDSLFLSLLLLFGFLTVTDGTSTVVILVVIVVSVG